jgi:hypothetical protein
MQPTLLVQGHGMMAAHHAPFGTKGLIQNAAPWRSVATAAPRQAPESGSGHQRDEDDSRSLVSSHLLLDMDLDG